MLLKNSSQFPVAFVVSDTLSLRRTVLRRWQYSFACLHSRHATCWNNTTELYFLASPNPVLHVAYTDQRRLAFNLAMFDTFLFSLCEQHLITLESGFGRIGAFAASKQRNIFSFPPKGYLFCSNMSQSISLQESGYHWSGIYCCLTTIMKWTNLIQVKTNASYVLHKVIVQYPFFQHTSTMEKIRNEIHDWISSPERRIQDSISGCFRFLLNPCILLNKKSDRNSSQLF